MGWNCTLKHALVNEFPYFWSNRSRNWNTIEINHMI